MKNDGFKYGIIVSKKVGNSVVRHRVTRQLREIVRTSDTLPKLNIAIVIRSKEEIVNSTFSEIKYDVEKTVAKVVKRSNL
jgi:ribonuclease P protein component